MNALLDTLALLSLPGVGQAKARQNAWPTITEEQREHAYHQAETILQQCQQHNITALHHTDPRYPQQLHQLTDKPAVLYAQGNLQTLNMPGLAVIGTRKPTAWALKATQHLIRQAADHNLTIISGLAAGIDTCAHQTALAESLPTVAVVATGLDIIYPKHNAGLARHILQSNGLIISEQPPGTQVTSYQLLVRDRMQSILANAVAVIQTSASGGTTHTLLQAYKQNKAIIAPQKPQQTMTDSVAFMETDDIVPLLLTTPACDLHRHLPRFKANTVRATGTLAYPATSENIGQLLQQTADNTLQPSWKPAQLL